MHVRFGGLDLLFNHAGIAITAAFEKGVIEPGAVRTEFGQNISKAMQDPREMVDAPAQTTCSRGSCMPSRSPTTS